MFDIKYKNCYKKHNENKNVFIFSPFEKNNEINIKNTSDEYEIVISTKTKIKINNLEINNNKKKFLLRVNEKIKIKFLDWNDSCYFKLCYKKKINKENNSKILNTTIIKNNKNDIENFDWKKYLENCEDLRNVKNYTKENAWEHWINYGKNERKYFQQKIEKNNYILHITHKFGGGTDTYISNMINIFNNYKHVIFYILDNDTIVIDNNKTEINYLLNNFNISNIQCCFVHHLLYSVNNGLYVCFNLLDFINKLKCNKYFIIHDYFLLYNPNPNPTLDYFSKNNLTETNLKFINELFTKFDKIIFQSLNTYNNYKKKNINISNFFIINNVPDIQIYNNRIFPREKNIYNIGILGHISAIHKGRDLLKKILKLFENDTKYKFYIFGTFDEEKFNNLIVLGEYKNVNIFNLLKEYDIDMFLNISIVEETFSYTLSLELNTGLPIIYNTIGSYVDRLKNYNNCFGFTEENYYNIINIFNNIVSNTNNSIHFDTNIKYELVYNLPELNYFIEKNSEYTIFYDEYIKNLKNNTVIFLLISDIKNIITLNNLINDIVINKIYEKIDYIFIISKVEIGLLYQNYKIKLLYYSDTINHHKIIYNFINSINKNVNVIFIDIDNITNYENIYNFIVLNNNIILKELVNYDVIGIKKYNKFIHWYSSSNYIMKLNIKYDSKYFINNFDDPKYNFLEINNLMECSNSKKNLINNYDDIFNLNIEIPIYGIYFICCIGNYLNIIKNQVDKLISSELYKNSKKIICFICLYTEEIINLLNQYEKILIIKTTDNLYEKFAINNFKNYITDEKYYMYYIHSKSVSRTGKNYDDWRYICDYFTIEKWKLNILLLEYYDCIGINLRFYPKIHYSGNFWWSKSTHINMLNNIDDSYLSPEMYVCSKKNTKYANLFSSNTRHDITNYSKKKYITLTDEFLIGNILFIPEFNLIDKYCLINNKINNFKNFSNDDYFKIYNEEFKENNKEFLYEHYINYGIKENRYKCFNIPSKKNVVIITSKIYVSNNKFSYIDIRSIYSSQDRFEQTIDSIKTIKKYIPNNFIIIIDNSKFNNDEIDLIESNVDLFLNPIENKKLKYYTDECIYKAYGELNQTAILLECLSYLINNGIIELINLFKITGRYLINENFNYANFNNNKNILKINENVKDRKYYYTCFYKISSKNYEFYNSVINNLIDEINKSKIYDNIDYEVFFPPKLNKITLFKKLGITQNIGVWDEKTMI